MVAVASRLGTGHRESEDSILTPARGFKGMAGFTAVAVGQFFSLLGTNMTGMALTIWIWEKTGAATAVAVLGFAVFLPQVIFSPLAGALVDRWNRKLVMMLSDIGAGLGTIAFLALYLTGTLQTWHLFVGCFVVGAFSAFQFPAYSAATTLMVPKEQYARAGAIVGLAQSTAGIFAPIAAGALIGVLGLAGIMAIDLVTMSIALGILLFVHVPQPAVTAAGREGAQHSRGSLLRDSLYGFRYILARPSLLGLQLVFTIGNFLSTMAFTLANPLVLARTANNTVILGTVQSVAGIGAVAGGLLITLWGGPKRKVYGVIAGWTGAFLFETIGLGIGRSAFLWSAGLFVAAAFSSLINASNQAIWQRKVPPDVQGRVFAIRSLIAQVAGPLGQILAGPLADYVFEPGMRPGGALAGVFGGLTGTGPGTGMAVIFLLTGILGLIASLSALGVRSIREVETIVPDHDAAVKPEADQAVAAAPVAEGGPAL